MPKKQYKTGDPLEGDLLISTDKEFRCEGVLITFLAREYTKIVVSGPNNTSSTHYSENVYAKRTNQIRQAGYIPSGRTRVPFRFEIPKSCLSSYHGEYSHVEYTLEVKVEIPWDFDLKSKGEVTVTSLKKPPKPRHLRALSDRSQFPDLQMEVMSDVVCIGEDLMFKICVSDDKSIRGIRIDVVNHEWARAGEHTRTRDNIVLRKYFPKEKIKQNAWILMKLKTSRRIPTIFEAKDMKSNVSLKITMDIPFATDISIHCPIIPVYCPMILEDDTLTYETLY
ncbi:MAG: hypothetical protein ACFFEJ_07715 [Candidatus Thorarchaeota archaeon]